MTFKGELAGELREINGGTRFLYKEGWTETIACGLPIDRREHFWASGLHPFFEHLGPEGWLRAQQARGARANDQDDFKLLIVFGADCIGAVGVRAPDDLPPPPGTTDLAEAAATAPGRTLSGVQKKLLVHRGSAGFETSHRPDDPATHIAKFNREAFPTIVQNEDISLRLARAVLGKKDVTEAAIDVVTRLDEVALIVERFDRRGSERLRLEDFAQILAIPHGPDHGGKYRSSYEEAASVIARHSARALVDLDRYFRLVAFNCIIGNADAHLKNFSLLERPEGLRLSPAYDLVNTCLYPTLDADSGLELGGAKRPLDTISRRILAAFGAEIGLPAKAVDAALGEIERRFAATNIPALPKHYEVDDFRLRYRDLVANNLRRIFA